MGSPGAVAIYLCCQNKGENIRLLRPLTPNLKLTILAQAATDSIPCLNLSSTKGREDSWGGQAQGGDGTALAHHCYFWVTLLVLEGTVLPHTVKERRGKSLELTKVTQVV